VADAEIVLVADIDRGGMFASVLGTLELLPADLRARVRGLIINKFRGDVSLLEPGLEFLRERTGVAVLGVVPFLSGTGLPDEDSLALARHRGGVRAGLDELEVAVVDLPYLANFEDVLPLGEEPGVRLRLTAAPRELLEADLVVLAGSKSTVHDLAFLRERGLDVALARRAARGEPIVGICGGAQILGQRIDDPEGIESTEPSVAALGLLPHHTRYESPKVTRQVRGELHWGRGVAQRLGRVEGFELHHGRMVGADGAECALRLDDGQPEGCQRNGMLATMVHRVFDQPAARAALLDDLRARRSLTKPTAAQAPVDPYDRLAEHVRSALDWPALRRIALGDSA
jgi:adenosylcobyric acid synthase